jgi:glycosyltransferase involved in cell wall biosynthesis
MFCSTVIATIGRPTLSRAVKSVLAQRLVEDEFEVIVVNDSGKVLTQEDWHRSKRVRIINTNRRERCFARNSGASIAKGKYLHFLDDDDWISNGALQGFWDLAGRAPHAAWLYGAARFITPTGEVYGELEHSFSGNCFTQLVAGVWIPLQASLIDATAYFDVGGFDPSYLSTQDLHLSRCISLRGSFAGMELLVAHILRGGDWTSSTDYGRAPEFVRRGRDSILSEPGAFGRMQSSANNGFWHGRVFHAYSSTALYNLRQMRLFRAIGRTLLAMTSLILAGPRVVSPRFWKAVRTHHVSRSFH